MPKFDKGESAIMEKETFSIDDAEKIVKTALGNDALKRADRMTDRDITEEEYKKYEEADKLSPDIRNIWWKTENKRAQALLLAEEFKKEKSFAAISGKQRERLSDLIEDLAGRADVLSEAQSIVVNEKVPDRIVKALDDLINDYQSNLSNQDFLKESGEENEGKVSNSLKTAISELTNYKNQVKFITSNNNENFMPESSSKELSSIINIQKNNNGEEAGQILDPDLARDMADKSDNIFSNYKKEFPKDSNKEIGEVADTEMNIAANEVFKKETGVEYDAAVQEAMKDQKGTEDEIKKEADNNDEIVNDRAADINDGAARNEIIGDNDEARQKVNNEVINSKEDAERKIGEIETGPQSKEAVEE